MEKGKITSINQKKSFTLPSLGAYSSRKEWEEACWHRISASKDALQFLTTEYEKRNIILRGAILERIYAGKSYKEISEEFFVSPQTISIIKKAIAEKKYQSYLERSKKERKTKEYSSYTSLKTKHKGKLIRTKYGTKYISHPIY